jgi:D-aminopeptidase
MWQSWVLAVISLSVTAGPLQSQSAFHGNWTGTATFSDGASENWLLRLSPGDGRLLFDAGTGLLLRNIQADSALLFDLIAPGIPEGYSCSLSLYGDRLIGTCGPGAGDILTQLSFDRAAEQPPEVRERPRAREAGLVVGVFPTGPQNAITDVSGVQVGHVTVQTGEDIRTGVTAIIPAPGDLYSQPLPAWVHTVNGYGKLIGGTQVREFGEIEAPILLTCTLCVWSAARSLAWTLMEQDTTHPEHTINPVVGETNDSWVNDMWQDPIQRQHVEEALGLASSGPVPEGSIGAGTGTTAFGWKGGIGTSSRRLPESLGGYTVGVLVQTNFGGNLTMNGAPVGRELGSYLFRAELGDDSSSRSGSSDGGSLMIVVAADAPLDPNALRRLAERAMLGAARTGSFAHNSSGDYVIAFSTAESVRRMRPNPEPRATSTLPHAQMSPLFAAVTEATEESIYNAMLKATTVSGRGRVLEAIPLAATLEILERYGALHQDRMLLRR